jgi:hypothetical protein
MTSNHPSGRPALAAWTNCRIGSSPCRMLKSRQTSLNCDAVAASTKHTDLQMDLVRAEVISFADFVECGGETGAKRAGKMRPELKTYVMQDCDVTNFRSSK